MSSKRDSRFTDTFRLPRSLEVCFAVLIVLELVAPFVTTTYGVDAAYHLRWVDEFTTLISQGIALPRWVPGAYFGFGAPSFYFYPPFAYYVASTIRTVIGSADARVLYQMTGLVATVASFFSAREFLKAISVSRYQAALGAALYAFAPFRIAELYSRSNLSTHVGYIFPPLIWFGLFLLVRGEPGSRLKGIMVLAVSSALLAITSIPLLLVTLTCGVIAAIVNRKQITLVALRDVAIAGVIGIALAAFQLSSSVAFRAYANVEDLLVVKPEFLVTLLLHGTGFPAAFHLTLVYTAVCLIGYTYWRRGKSGSAITAGEAVLARSGIAIFAVVAFLELPRVSLPFWTSIPPLRLIQGGWRFYSHGVLLVAVLAAIASSRQMQQAAKAISWIWVVGGLLPAMMVAFNLHLYKHYERPADDTIEYLTKYAPSRTDFMPIMRAHAGDPITNDSFATEERLDSAGATPVSAAFSANLISAHRVTFHRFYWPAWHLYANGVEIASRPDSIGRATVLLPPGQYRLEWKLERTPLETAGIWISGLTAFGILITAGIAAIRGRVKKQRLKSS